jgi:hypothetical protein
MAEAGGPGIGANLRVGSRMALHESYLPYSLSNTGLRSKRYFFSRRRKTTLAPARRRCHRFDPTRYKQEKPERLISDRLPPGRR